MTGTSRFLLLGEPLALDLVNTRVRRDGVDVDLLDKPAALAAWLGAQRHRLTWRGRIGKADLAAVCRLRDAIDHLLQALRAFEHPPVAALHEFNRVLSKPGNPPCLAWAETGPCLVAPPSRSQRAALLHALALDAAGVLTGPQARRLRECAHPDCRLQFVAGNARRRWCSDALCGNRARVARHYARRHEAG